ncbi:hypothetical protein L6164_007553 [Bauhinia variegata]|uniref:Uncharacterized protein n=1 Tax=Bauhinia variegata TaxID=167791 RepID=A0ACB9PDT1_BAUVA|nr:hypothetical protein L6164_007553 [Bauhinia variegata]
MKFQPLIPSLAISHEKASVLAQQITLFPNSGFSIGITIHHAILDGKTSTSFLKSWAYICSNLTESSASSPPALPENLAPFYDREVIKDPSEFCQTQINGWKNFYGPNNRSLMVWNWVDKIPAEAIRGTFELTPSHLQKLRESAASKFKDKSSSISRFALACAYAWALMVKADQTKINRAILIIAVDCRETKNLLGNDGFVSALEAIMEAFDRLEEKGVLLSNAKTFVMDLADPTEQRVFTIAGSPRFEVYSIDFGWGRPMKVEMTSIDKTGAFCLVESKHGNGGIEIGLVLSKPLMESFATLFAHGLESL